MSPKSFKAELEDGVLTFTLNRPDKLNALTFEVYNELREAFEKVDGEDEVRSIVLTGEGRGFCSGGDAKDIIAKLFDCDMAGLLEFTRCTGALVASIRKVRRPVIAAVNGTCVGAGAVIAIACDLRISSDDAVYGFIFPKVGLCGADMGAAYLLPRIVGLGRASELLFFGDILPADEALQIGLVNRVVPKAECLSLAKKWADKLAAGPAFAHSMTKQMIETEHTMSLEAAIEAEAQAQAICMQHPDFRTAHEAWKSKSKPTFRGAPRPFDSG